MAVLSCWSSHIVYLFRPFDSAAQRNQTIDLTFTSISTDQWQKLGQLYNAARGTITSVDLDAVRNAPGVLAVLTAKDIPGVNDCSPAMGDDPILADSQIVFHGQVVFAVVAETRDQCIGAGIRRIEDEGADRERRQTVRHRHPRR